MSEQPPVGGPKPAEPLLEVRNLRTWFETDRGTVRAVDGVSFTIGAGETLGIVGESGSGKSVTGLSIMRLLEHPARIAGGEIVFRGRDVIRLGPDEVRRLRGRDVSMIFQDPMTSLNPVLRIAKQLVEGLRTHQRAAVSELRARAVRLLGRMGITTPERAIDAYPHEFSGGMRQRVMLAMGFGNEPALLIADEPTTALDVTIQAQILDLLKELNADFGAAVLLISHDLGVIASVCERIVVMYAGEVVEEGPTRDILKDPRHPYSWALLNAVPKLEPAGPDRRLTTIEGTPPDPLRFPAGCRFAPRCPFRIERCDEHPELLPVGDGRGARCWVTQERGTLREPEPSTPTVGARTTGAPDEPDPSAAPILALEGVVKHFPLRRETLFGRRRVAHAVDGVDLAVRTGEIVGLVGESGCGKSTLARLITRIHEPTAGRITFEGQDISHASRGEIRPLRRRMQMIFQDPYASLNPRMTVGQILAEPLVFHGLVGSEAESRERVQDLLALVGLGAGAADSYPHEFSGGQRQRIGTARALAVEPALIVADEPISSLDVNIQAQIINLFLDLQERLNLTFLFIAHDLLVVRHVSDRVVVLYLGRVMEIAPANDLFARPLHPYTVSLISAVPVADVDLERARRRIRLEGEPPSVVDPPSGCPFRTRCPIARPVCAEEVPPLRAHRDGHFAACHFPGELAPTGS